MKRRAFLVTAAAGLAAQTVEIPKRVKVPGVLRLRGRERAGRVTERLMHWPVAETAIIICDMWDTHTCSLAAQRVSVMAPRMNQVVSAARGLGVTIIHAPSDTMKFYEGTPARRRMQSAPRVDAAIPIASCPREPGEAREFPIDDAGGGCDDAVVKKWTGPYPWTRQHPAIDIVGFDGVSDNGQEIYNYFKQEGITNIALMGVHTNMCILNRSFAIRQMKRLGMNIVLVRDLTDAMYDPRSRPFVSHTRGTELVIEHIEAKWCPSVVSEDLMRVSLEGAPAKRT
jgi:nicotinamidase-related amidase